MVLFRHNLPQPTKAQLMRGEFPETLCIEQGVVLSFRFAERKVRRAPRVLRVAVVSQSSVKFGKKRVLLVGATNFMTITAKVATSKFLLFINFTVRVRLDWKPSFPHPPWERHHPLGSRRRCSA